MNTIFYIRQFVRIANTNSEIKSKNTKRHSLKDELIVSRKINPGTKISVSK